MSEVGSSVPRRQLGRYLKKLREEAGIDLEPAARELEWSRARQYRIERGEVPLRTHDVVTMCQLYGAPADLTEVLVSLARESKSKGWWHAYGDVIPDWFELYVGLEAAASSLRRYDSAFIPGLLQTPEYADAVLRTQPGASEADVARRANVRLERQKLLTRRAPKPPTLDVIVDEAVLRRPIGDVDAWRKQLAHLSNSAEARHICVRVLPASVGPHSAFITGAFVILGFPSMRARQAEPTTVYSESLTGALYLDREREVAAYVRAWQALESLALSGRESQDLIAEIIKESFDE